MQTQRQNSPPASAAEQPGGEMLAIVGGTVIECTGGVPIEDGVIVIDGKRIVAVGKCSTPIPAGAKQISAQGKFVIPGLMAPFTILVDGAVPSYTMLYEGRYDEVMIESAQFALKGGVTTVIDTWGPLEYLIKARNAISEGKATAARIYLCGNVVGWGGPYSLDLRPQYRGSVGEAFAKRIDSLWEANVGEALTWMSPEEVRREVRTYAESGIDYLSYALNVHRLTGNQHFYFSPRVQRAIVEEAHRAGLPVRAYHATTSEGMNLALEAGADMVVSSPHGPLTPEMVERVAQRQVACTLGPLDTSKLLDWAAKNPVPDMPADTMSNLFKVSIEDERALIRAGAMILSGALGMVHSADALNFGRTSFPVEVLGEHHVTGLRVLQERGMKPMDALLTATRNIAKAFKVDKDLGTLEKGKLADLVILDKNPLENAENYRSIHVVMKEGRVIDRDSLPTQRLLTASSAAAK